MLRRQKIKLNWSVGAFGLHVIPTRVDHSFRGIAGDHGDVQHGTKDRVFVVLQFSTRIVSPGRKVSASTSHTAPRWVPILDRENRSSYLQARLSKDTVFWPSAAEAAVRFSPQKRWRAGPIEQVAC